MNADDSEFQAQVDEEKIMETNGLMDEGTDELGQYFVRALWGSASLSIAPGEELSSYLTDEDRRALALLGTPQQVAERIVARARHEKAPAVGMGESMLMAGDPLASTVANCEDAVSLISEDRERLLMQEIACRKKTHFAWDYEFEKSQQAIGSGGQGTVYLLECVQPFVGKRALKVLSPRPYPTAQAYDEDMQRMRAVAAVVHQICHDNIILVERFESYNDIYTMNMRLIDGFDLQRLRRPDVVERLKKCVGEKRWGYLNGVVYASRGPDRWGLAPGVAVNIVEKCLRGLMALHGKGILHCDLKPSNIMLDRWGSIRIVDIGSAFHVDARPKQHAWTPWYAPPEVLEGKPWTPQGDLASLGYVLVELLSGRPELMWPVANTESVYTLNDKTRDALIRAKHALPDRLKELLPAEAQKCEILMKLCRLLIHPDPAAQFRSAGVAINHTAEFTGTLIMANLWVTWVREIEHWILDVQNSTHST